MNCSEARSLFSARVDFELTGPKSLEHDRHLGNCSQCDHEWRSFQLTVRMVRTLPAENASASFVGQVLDKVRAYEAQPVPSYLDPADRPTQSDPSPARAPQWKARLREIFAPLRSPVPAFAAASLVLGIVVGVVAMDWRSQSAGEARTAQIERIDPTPDLSTRGVAGDHSVNPFADLADEIDRLPSVERRALVDPYEMLPPAPVWSGEPGLQQQVRAGDARPRITF
jgi:hypothetical protein